MLTQEPAADWLTVHRRVWDEKRILRQVYSHWFALLRRACAPGGPSVELGCGPAFLKGTYPEIVATDTSRNPHADCVVDAQALPFGAATLANLLMLDVFHHVADPQRLLQEAARVLRPGGRMILLEPWLGLAGRCFFRYVHHEQCDLHVDPARPWDAPDKEPMQGNVALPFLFFGPGGHLDRLSLPLALIERRPFAALPWLLSGGFQPFSLLPAGLVGAAEALDRLLSRAPALTASRCLLVVERVRGRD